MDCCVCIHGHQSYIEVHYMADGGRASIHRVGQRCCAVGVLGAQHAFFRNQILLYLGKISYGLYVLHELAHFCAIRLVHASTPFMVRGAVNVGLALTILLAAASYRWLESPFLRLKERFAHVQSRPV